MATAFSWSTKAQTAPPVAYQPQLISYPGVPFGPCDIYQVALNVSNGNYYSCTPGTRTWTLLAGGVQNVASAPVGACVNGGLVQVTGTGLLYSCQANVWTLVNTGTSGSGAPTNPCATGLAYTDNTTGNYYSCNAGTWLLVGPQTTSSGPACTTDTFTATPTYTFGNDQCHIMTLTGNVTSITIAGSPANKQILYLKFPQDGTGGRTVTFPGSFVLPTGFSLGITANHQNNMAWQFDGTLWRPLTDFGGGSGGGGSPGGVNRDTQCNAAGSFGACANETSIRYACAPIYCPTANDANSGLTWDTAKATIMAAVCSLPSGNCSTNPKVAGAGQVFFSSAVNCNSVSTGGCWIAGPGDSQNPSMASAVSGPTAWAIAPVSNTTGLKLSCATKDVGPAHANTRTCQVNGPDKSAGIGNLPTVWITGSYGVDIDGLSTGPDLSGNHIQSAAWGRIGIDSTTTEIIGTPTLTQTPSITIENSSSAGNNSSLGPLGSGPQLIMGNGFWIHLHDFQMYSNDGESCQISAISRTSNVVTVTTTGCGASSSSCPFVTGDHLSIKDVGTDTSFNGTFTAASSCSGNSVTFNQTGANSSSATVVSTSTIADDRAFGIVSYQTQWEAARLHMEGNGIKIYGGPNSNFQMYDAYMEGIGNLNQPFIWESSLVYGGGGIISVAGIHPADTPQLPAIINDASNFSAINSSSQNTFSKGPAIFINGADSTNRTTGLIENNQSGWYNNTYFESQNDIARRQGSPSAVLGTNQANQSPASWINTASGTATGFTTATGKTDPFGGTGAVEIDSTGGNPQIGFGTTGSIALTVGDVWEFGVWVRNANNGTLVQPVQFIINLLGSGSGNLCNGTNGNAGPTVSVPFAGDGNWFWVSGQCIISAAPSNSNITLAVGIAPTVPIQVFRPWIIKVSNSSSLSATEKVDEANSVTGGTSAQASAGDVAFYPGQKFCLPSSSTTNEFCGYEIHSNTANRTYTFPDSTGTVVLTTTTAPPWSSITNPTANETLSMGTNTSEFDFTSSLNEAFEWANTTAATSGTSQGSPQLALCGNAWHAGASSDDCWTLNHAPGNGADATITDTYGHTGSSTGVINSAFPGPVISGAPNPAGVAGAVVIPQGTANTVTSAAVTIQGGTGITGYNLSLPNVAPTTGNNFMSCPVPSGSPATSVCTWQNGSSAAPLNNIYYLSPSCSVANVNNCYNTPWDTQQRADCTVSTNQNVSCTASNFTQADVGKNFVDFIKCGTDSFTSAQGPNRTETTITTVTDATHIVVGTSGSASASGTACIYYGHSDETGLTAVETALASASTCPILMLPAGIGWQEAAHFIQSIPICTQDPDYIGGGLTGHGQQIIGQGKTVTKIFWSPNFSQTTCTGGGGTACMGGQQQQVFKGFRITGGGNTSASNFSANHNLFETKSYARLEDMGFENLGQTNSHCTVVINALGLVNITTTAIVGFSTQVQVTGGGQVFINQSSIQDINGLGNNSGLSGNFRVVSGSVWSTQNNYANGALSATNNAAVAVANGSRWFSQEDSIFADLAINRPVGFSAENGSTVALYNGGASAFNNGGSNTLGAAISNSGTAVLQLSNFFCNAPAGDTCITGPWVDLGGVLIASGSVSSRTNDLSITTTPGFPGISSGFGSGAAVTAHHGPIAFSLNVGTGGTASSGVISLPTTDTGWVCTAFDITNPTTGGGFFVKQTAGTTSTATLTGYNTAGSQTAWTASDILRVSCRAF